MHADLDSRLRHLRLSGMAATLPVRNQEAVRNSLAHMDFLDLLVEDELNRRRDRLLERRIKQAALPQMKTLDNFDWSFNPDFPKALILDLCTARYVTERTGVLFVGPPGVGKTASARAWRWQPSTPATWFCTAPRSTSPKTSRKQQQWARAKI